MEEKIVNIISDALENPDVNIDSSVDNTTEWDSLGQLGILSALDKASNGQVNNYREFNTASSVKEIIELFSKNNINI